MAILDIQLNAADKFSGTMGCPIEFEQPTIEASATTRGASLDDWENGNLGTSQTSEYDSTCPPLPIARASSNHP